MRIKKILKPFIPHFILKNYAYHRNNIEKFSFDINLDIKRDIIEKYKYHGDLLDIFVGNRGSMVHKWHHYIPIYERYFSPFRGKKIRFLEIGVSEGGSLQMWRKYFGEEAIIFGIDINPECIKFNGIDGQVRIGSQSDEEFLKSIVVEMGGIDIVLDDGSHNMTLNRATLEILFPMLSQGGIYMVEDLHTSFWHEFEGGYYSKKNFFKYLNGIVNDMHHWYHKAGVKNLKINSNCTGIHLHDSIAVLEKGTSFPPVHSKVQN
jgi:hypothetical protein